MNSETDIDETDMDEINVKTIERPVITLPIMCSTLKSFDRKLEEFIYAEGAFVGLVNLIYLCVTFSNVSKWWSMFFIMGNLIPATNAVFPQVTPDGALLFVSTIIFEFWMFLYLVDIIIPKLIVLNQNIWNKIWSKIPRLECIKDEQEKEQNA